MKKIEHENETILMVILNHPNGVGRGQIESELSIKINGKTLQRRLSKLSEENRIHKEGTRKTTKYFPFDHQLEDLTGQNISGFKDQEHNLKDTFYSLKSQKALKFLSQPAHAREIVSYKRRFLESYVPNKTAYILEHDRAMLLKAGKRVDERLTAGTYAKKIGQRLLIDLSYNSSRLEGNTYSKLDTEKLVMNGISAEGKIQEETVMIMNHKEAILFLVENAPDVELDSLTVRNLHNLLAQDLLANPEACGKIRQIEVNIGRSTYIPLANAHIIRELLELILLKARKIDDPFEQSFFVLIHLSYLQAFEDVNKRTSRLTCNIPLIKHKLCPLSFVDVPMDNYTAALLAVYEKNLIQPMLELYCWAYFRSCKQYSAVKESLGEIDVFRVRYRQQRKEAMGFIVNNDLHETSIDEFLEKFCKTNRINEVDKFTAMTRTELSTLHSGAIVGLGITENQLIQWKKI